MSYKYEVERENLFTDEGQRMFLRIRDQTNALLDRAGAVRMIKAMANVGGSTWTMMACLDRMVELKEIREVTVPDKVCGQDRVFVRIEGGA